MSVLGVSHFSLIISKPPGRFLRNSHFRLPNPDSQHTQELLQPHLTYDMEYTVEEQRLSHCC